MSEDKTPIIRALNNVLRTTFIGGRVNMTAAVATLPADFQEEVLTAVREFREFNEDNDPHGEHDCATVVVRDRRFIWKIDYYDTSLTFASPDPADSGKTIRVLTIMAAEDY